MEQKPKKLYRSRTNKQIGGVAGGLGEYFGIDPVLIRIVWLIAFLGLGTGLLLYIILWIVIPEEPEFEAVYKMKNEEYL